MELDTDDKDIHKLVEYCTSLGLSGADYFIYDKKVTQCIKSKEYERAINLCRKTYLRTSIDKVYRQMIVDFVKSGVVYELDENDDGLFSDIYHGMTNMHTGYVNHDGLLATTAFKELIANTAVPTDIMVVILYQAMKLVEGTQKKIFHSM